MPVQLVLRSQKNEILDLVRQGGFEPAEFSWDEVHSNNVLDLSISRLVHAPTGAFITFDFLEDHHWSKHSPGRDKSLDSSYPGDWKTQSSLVRDWLGWLRREVEAPDLWSVLSAKQPLTAPEGASLGNERFAPDEVHRIAIAVHELHKYIETTLHLTEQHQKVVSARLQHLQESSERLGRKDWVALALGTLANIVVGVALAPEAAKDLLKTANALLGWVVQSATRLMA